MRNKLLFLLLMSFVMMGCNDDELSVVVDDTSKPSNETRAIVSGIIGTESTTNPSLYDDWENVSEIMLNSGILAPAPWFVEEGHSISIPDGIRTDVKKSDGWTMLGHTLEKVIDKPNYILFYHKKSGILKGFCYVKFEFEPNENFTWVIEADKPTSMIPSNKKESDLIDVQYQYATTSNVLRTSVTSASGALRPGWNCFTFELPYGLSNDNPIIGIDGYNVFKSTLVANGTFSGQVIVPETVTSNQWKDWQGYFQEASTLTGSIGQFGKAWDANKNPTSPQKINGTQTRSVMGVLGIISAAASVISNVIGVASHFTSKDEVVIHRYDLGGNIELTGDIVSGNLPSIAPVYDFDIMKLNNNDALGVWGLKTLPVVKYDKYGMGQNLQPFPIGESDGYTTHSRSVYLKPQLDKTAVVINPALLAEVKNYSVTTKAIFCSKDANNRITSAYGDFRDYVTLSDGWHIIEFKNDRLLLEKRLNGREHYLPPGFKMINYWFPFTIDQELYTSVTVNIEYNDGSVYSSGRLFKVDVKMNDNKKSINSQAPFLDIIL